VCSVFCTDSGALAGGAPKALYERVAGIDVHKDMVKVAIRSPGDKPWTRKTEILELRKFYGVLQEMAVSVLREVPGRPAWTCC